MSKTIDIGDLTSLSKHEVNAIKDALVNFGFNVQLVRSYMLDVWELAVSAKNIKRIETLNKAELVAARAKYFESTEEVPIASYAVRQRRREELYQQFAVVKERYSFKKGKGDAAVFVPVKVADVDGMKEILNDAERDHHNEEKLIIAKANPQQGRNGRRGMGTSAKVAQLGNI